MLVGSGVFVGVIGVSVGGEEGVLVGIGVSVGGSKKGVEVNGIGVVGSGVPVDIIFSFIG